MKAWWVYWPQLLQGVGLTLVLVFSALLIGLMLAIAFTILKNQRIPGAAPLINGYSFLIRGTPLLVQIYLLYYGLGQFSWLIDSPVWPLFSQPLSCAILALAINTSAYTFEILEAAYRSIPVGEIEAGRAFGMKRRQLFWRVLLPRTTAYVLPAYSNEAILLLKASSLASTITLLDLMGVTQQIISQTYDSITYLLLAAALYLLLNIGIMSIFRLLEKRFPVHRDLSPAS